MEPVPGAIDRELWVSTIEAALEVRQRAYVPYSRFQVGAAILLSDKSLVVGANVENCSYSLTQCAERAAAQQAVVQGRTDWELLVVASRGGVTPCGACRQVLAEFVSRLPILIVDAESPNRQRWTNLLDLLPDRFHAGGWSVTSSDVVDAEVPSTTSSSMPPIPNSSFDDTGSGRSRDFGKDGGEP